MTVLYKDAVYVFKKRYFLKMAIDYKLNMWECFLFLVYVRGLELCGNYLFTTDTK